MVNNTIHSSVIVFFSLLLFFPLFKYCINHTTFYKIIKYVRYYIFRFFVYNFFVLIMLITIIFQDIMQEIRAPTYKGYKNRITLIGYS